MPSPVVDVALIATSVPGGLADSMCTSRSKSSFGVANRLAPSVSYSSFTATDASGHGQVPFSGVSASFGAFTLYTRGQVVSGVEFYLTYDLNVGLFDLVSLRVSLSHHLRNKHKCEI